MSRKVSLVQVLKWGQEGTQGERLVEFASRRCAFRASSVLEQHHCLCKDCYGVFCPSIKSTDEHRAGVMCRLPRLTWEAKMIPADAAPSSRPNSASDQTGAAQRSYTLKLCLQDQVIANLASLTAFSCSLLHHGQFAPVFPDIHVMGMSTSQSRALQGP